MTLNKRERLIALVVGGAIAFYFGYTFAYQPLYEEKVDDYSKQIIKLTTQKKANDSLIKNETALKKNWDDFIKNTMSGGAPPAAQANLVMIEIYKAALRNGVNIENYRQVRSSPAKNDFEERRYTIVAGGSTPSVWPFILALESQGLPVRIDDVNIKSRKDGTDDLAIDLNLTMLVYAPPAATRASTRGAGTRAATTGRGVDNASNDLDAVVRQMEEKRRREEQAPATQLTTAPAIPAPVPEIMPGTAPATAPVLTPDEAERLMIERRMKESVGG